MTHKSRIESIHRLVSKFPSVLSVTLFLLQKSVIPEARTVYWDISWSYVNERTSIFIYCKNASIVRVRNKMHFVNLNYILIATNWWENRFLKDIQYILISCPSVIIIYWLRCLCIYRAEDSHWVFSAFHKKKLRYCRHLSVCALMPSVVDS